MQETNLLSHGAPLYELASPQIANLFNVVTTLINNIMLRNKILSQIVGKNIKLYVKNQLVKNQTSIF